MNLAADWNATLQVKKKGVMPYLFFGATETIIVLATETQIYNNYIS